MQKLLLSEKIVILAVCSMLSASTLPVLAVDSTTPATAQAGSQVATQAAPAATTPASPTSTPAAAAAPAGTAGSTTAARTEDSAPAPKVLWKPGQSLETSTDTEDIVATYDIELARKQVAAYPDSPEAAFILAVALTRTSRVEEALQEVKRARKLAESKGGPAYFDKLIASYEKMLTGYPNDNQVRYGLAWAYYMKAYLLGSYSRKVARWKAANAAQIAAQAQGQAGATTAGAGTTSSTAAAAPNTGVDNKDVLKALKTGNAANALGTLANIATGQVKTENLPHIPTALEKVDPADIPTIKSFYEKALGKIDEILQREPNDIWSIVYSAHLRAEYSGNLEASMKIWRDVAAKNPSNPAPYFFLGEGYLKQGNLKESINNVSKAIALRAIGN